MSLSVFNVKVVPLHPRRDETAFDDRGQAAEFSDAADKPPPPHPATPVIPKQSHILRRRRRTLPAAAAVLARAATSTKTVFELLDAALPAVPAIAVRPAAEPPRPKPDFWEIWLSHEQYLRTHSLRFASGNRADAEDALSEAMLKAAQIFENDTIRNERAWLLRLVHNACMDRHRDKRRINRFEKVISEIETSSAPAVAAPPERSPEELLSALEEFDMLKKAMNALPVSLSDPLLRYLDEQSDAQIAESLNVTKEVVRKRRQIARDILRRALNSSL